MKSEERIDRALENLLSPQELADFQAEVVADPEFRALYVERAWLHGTLQSERDALPKLLAQEKSKTKSSVGLFKWAAVAALGLGLFFFSFSRQSDPNGDFVAVLIETKDCRWEGSELPTNEGAKLKAGTLTLAEGLATLQFESGAVITLEAPAKIEVLSKMHCRLLDGSVVADVPESAHGFTIDTAEMEVVDLGTRFGITTNQFGSSHVIVFEGEVEVKRTGQDAIKTLNTGGTIHYGQNPPANNREPERVTSLTTTPDGWTAIPTSYGKGKDTFIRVFDVKKVHGNDPLVMVKHTDIAHGNERRTCLTFDLGGNEAHQKIDAAKLTLEIQSSGLGFSALIPDSRFAIYGVTDDRLDQWHEDSLKWADSPEITAPDLSPALFVRLGEFYISRGAAKGQIEVSTPELADFVQADANRLATFIIVRETGETDSSGLVHAFASKEHPNARPPTLWLKTSDSK